MFMFHIAFGMGLIALALGTGLMIWGMRNPGDGSVIAKMMGFLIAILAVGGLACSGYYNYKLWQFGAYGMWAHPSMMMQQNQTSKNMQNKTPATTTETKTKAGNR